MPEPLRLFWEAITVSGGPVGVEVLLPWIFLVGGVSLGLRVGAAIALAMVSNPLLKWLLAEPRPFMVDGGVIALTSSRGFGMPSGHAQGVVAAWGGLITFGGARLAWVGVPLILLTGWSRVVLGVHTWPQVAAGWMLGGLGVVLVAYAWRPMAESMGRLGGVGRAAVLVSTVAVILGLAGWIAEGVRGEFSAPRIWTERSLEAGERLGDVAWAAAGEEWIEIETMIPRVATVAGLALCGFWVLRFGAVVPRTFRERRRNLLWGLPAVAAWSLLWWWAAGSISLEWAEACRRLGLPLMVGVVVPNLSLGRREPGV